MALVQQVLPKAGDSKSAALYRKELMQRGYSFFQAIGSLGGASHGGSVSIDSKKIVTRL